MSGRASMSMAALSRAFDAALGRSPVAATATTAVAATAMAVLAVILGAEGCTSHGGTGAAGAGGAAGAVAAGESGTTERAGSGSGAEGEALPSAAAVVALVLDRGERVERITADLRLDLTRADGAEATLDATLRMARPDRVRVRSTKWGLVVCDVVVHGGDAHALLSPVVREQALASAEASMALARVLTSLGGWYEGVLGGAGRIEIVEERPEAIVVRLPDDGRAGKSASIGLEWTLARSDGRTLKVRRFEDGACTGILECGDHVDVDGVPLPSRLRFESAAGRIDVEVSRPRVNPPMDARAFELPQGAVTLP